MGNQQTMCCADTTGRMELESVSSADGYPQNNGARGKPRMLKRFLDTIRPVNGRRDQVGPQQQPVNNSFFKGKFASSTMQLEMEMETDPSMPAVETRKPRVTIGLDAAATAAAPAKPEEVAQRHRLQLRSMSSMSSVGDNETRSDRCLTRRTSACSGREGCEDERERMEPESDARREATE